jgi:hypothetical protein
VCLIYGSLFNAERRGGGDPSVLINLLKSKNRDYFIRWPDPMM